MFCHCMGSGTRDDVIRVRLRFVWVLWALFMVHMCGPEVVFEPLLHLVSEMEHEET